MRIKDRGVDDKRMGELVSHKVGIEGVANEDMFGGDFLKKPVLYVFEVRGDILEFGRRDARIGC